MKNISFLLIRFNLNNGGNKFKVVAIELIQCSGKFNAIGNELFSCIAVFTYLILLKVVSLTDIHLFNYTHITSLNSFFAYFLNM